jgi:hypothetical protein
MAETLTQPELSDEQKAQLQAARIAMDARRNAQGLRASEGHKYVPSEREGFKQTRELGLYDRDNQPDLEFQAAEHELNSVLDAYLDARESFRAENAGGTAVSAVVEIEEEEASAVVQVNSRSYNGVGH